VGAAREIAQDLLGSADLQQALLGGLRALGYVEGQNLRIEYRFMLGQSKTCDDLAAELSGLAPDAIVVVGTPPALLSQPRHRRRLGGLRLQPIQRPARMVSSALGAC
jgi:hypothetical protein